MSSQAGSVFSLMAVQHLAKHCKYHKLCAACQEQSAGGNHSGQEPGPGTRTNSAISLLIFTEQGSESHCSGSHTALCVTAVCNTQRGGHRIDGAGKEREPPGDGTSQGTASPATPLQPHLPSAMKGCFAAAQPH